MYGETGGAEFPAANVARDRLRAPFHRGRRPGLLARVLGRTILRSVRLRLDLVRLVSVPIAAKVQRHRLLDRLGHRRHRGLRLHRQRREILDLGLTALRMTVKSLRLIRTAASLAGFRGAPRRRRGGGEYFQVARQTAPRVLLLLHRGQHFESTVPNRINYITKYCDFLI